MTLSLSRRTKHHPFWRSQTDLSNYSPWKIAFWWEWILYILWECVPWCQAFYMSNTSYSCFSMKEWVSLVWPMHNQDIMTCSLLDFLRVGLHSLKACWIWKSLLLVLLFHCCCHFTWRSLLILGFRSAYGILNLFGYFLIKKKIPYCNLLGSSFLSKTIIKYKLPIRLEFALPFVLGKFTWLTSPFGWGVRIHQLHLCRGVKPSPAKEYPGYNTK